MLKTIKKWIAAIKSVEIRDLDSYLRYSKVSYKYLPFYKFVSIERGYPLSNRLQKAIEDNTMTQTVMFPEVKSYKTSVDRITLSKHKKADNRWPGESIYYEYDEIKEIDDNKDYEAVIDIPIHVMLISLSIENQALEDVTFDCEEETIEAFSEANAVAFDQLIVHGDGQGKTRGLAPCDSETGKTSVNFINHEDNPEKFIIKTDVFDSADYVKEMLFGLPRQYRANAKWYMNSNTGLHIATLKDTMGNYLIDQRDESLRTVGVPDRLLGKPIVYNEYMNDIEEGCVPIILGDLSKAYAVGVGMNISVRRFADSENAQLDQVLLLGRSRMGGQSVNKEAYRILYIKPKVNAATPESEKVESEESAPLVEVPIAANSASREALATEIVADIKAVADEMKDRLNEIDNPK